jgi:hypothetical protein
MDQGRIHVWAWSVAVILLASCAGGQGGAGHTFRTDIQDGVRVAINEGGPKFDTELFEYIPLFKLEPGSSEETLLYNPGQLTADSEGWFYVQDAGNRDIVVFDPNGRFHHRFGRQGSGPGEFQFPRFLFTAADTLYVFDFSQLRTTRFLRTGELVDITTASPGARLGLSGIIPLTGGDRLLLPTGNDMSDDGMDSWCGILRVRASGDTVWRWQGEPIRTGVPISMTIGGRSMTTVTRLPFSPFPQAHYVPALGVVVSSGYVPQLHIYGEDGSLRQRVELDLGDLTITEADRQQVRNWYEERISETENQQSQEMMQSQLENLRFGDTKAPWSMIKFDDRGYLYLRHVDTYQPREVILDHESYMVISPDGEYLGTTSRPSGPSTEVVDGRLLVNRSDRETGEFTLTVYEIRPLVAGLDSP